MCSSSLAIQKPKQTVVCLQTADEDKFKTNKEEYDAVAAARSKHC